MTTSSVLPEVANQYENYPYPERNPVDERLRLYSPMLDCLDRVNYYCFEGKKRFECDFRALVAGGGTGDTVIFLAEQLRDYAADIVYLDISDASMEVAKQRAAVRGLGNIRWVKGSILDVQTLGLGKFDYINSCGVLHHLEDPGLGLSALASVLKDDGAMGIMVYAKYGRTAIYMIQHLMRKVNNGESSMHSRVENCGKILDLLPETHWFTHEIRLTPNWKYKKPIELYDLFLHSQDRAYTVPELYEYVESNDLHLQHLCLYGSDERGNHVYDPVSYIKDTKLLGVIMEMPERERQAIAELLHGKISTHSFYVTKQPRQIPSEDDLDNIPYLDIFTDSEEYQALYNLVRHSENSVELRRGSPEYVVNFRKTANCEGIFRFLDGKTTLGNIFKKIMSSQKYRKLHPTTPKLKEEILQVFSAFNTYEWMFYRSKGVRHPKTVNEIQARNSAS